MTEDEYRSKVDDLKKEHEKALKELAFEFAVSNSTVNVGDIVEDHIGKVLVESIRVATGTLRSSLPSCVYYGSELRKDGVPKKNGNKRVAWQCNLTT